MQFSFTFLLSSLFLLYIGNSIWSLVAIYIPPSCKEAPCLKSFLSTKPKLQLLIFTSLKSSVKSLQDLNLVHHWKEFDYNEESIAQNITIPIPEKTRRNGSLYIYGFLAPVARTEKESWSQWIQHPNSMYSAFPLTQYLVPEAETFNLLNGKEKVKKEEEKKTVGISSERKETHVCKHLRLNLMTDLHSLPRKELPMDLSQLLRLASSDTYLPPFKFDSFSSRLRNFHRINKSDDSYILHLEYTPASIGSLRMAAQFEAAMETMKSFGFSIKDLDEIKGIFSDTNIYLLALTMFVASFHLLFDFLAFKNDVQYWRTRKSTVGLSLRTILWRCFSHIVVFLYLLEEKSSMLVIVPGGIGALIEIWKVTKAFKISIGWTGGLPRLSFGGMSDMEKATAQHDMDSMRYLSYILYPLCLAGAVYSLLYTPHKSWYSWTIQSLVNGVYAFGFLFMLPQLYLNYKLKSVAHMNFKSFMYKAFNTFIDDLFAFIITTPYSHKVATLRDDVCFLIYLYQRWLYPVDKSRLDAGGEFEMSLEAEQTLESSSSSSSAAAVKDQNSQEGRDKSDVSSRKKDD